MSCGIYKITNNINNKVYIGQSINIEQRWKNHKHFEKERENYPLYKAFQKYGINNFSFEIIEECEPEELNEKEEYWINYYDSYDNGYNQTSGGDGRRDDCIKISNEQLLEIFDLLESSTLSIQEIANKYSVHTNTITAINNGRSRIDLNKTYPIRKREKHQNFCIDCKKEISRGAIRCSECDRKLHRVTERPNREELKEMIRTTSFLQIGKKYNVSDNTIRKWCISENLPSKKKEISSYSEEEWKLL